MIKVKSSQERLNLTKGDLVEINNGPVGTIERVTKLFKNGHVEMLLLKVNGQTFTDSEVTAYQRD